MYGLAISLLLESCEVSGWRGDSGGRPRGGRMELCTGAPAGTCDTLKSVTLREKDESPGSEIEEGMYSWLLEKALVSLVEHDVP